MGTEQTPSATLPGMRHRTRCGQILPHCGGPAPRLAWGCSSVRLTLCNHGARSGSARPQAQDPSPAASYHQPLLGAVNRLSKSGAPSAYTLAPKTGSTQWGTVAMVSQLASWAMGARPEVALPTTDRGEAEPGACWEGGWGGLHFRCLPPCPPPLLSMVHREGDHIIYCPNCDTFEHEEGGAIKNDTGNRWKPCGRIARAGFKFLLCF